MSIPSHVQRPRLCSLRKWENFAGYGFNLHSEKGKSGQFIGRIDPNSPAELGGLSVNDVLIEVNGINVEDASHAIVVGRVKSRQDQVELFVCTRETYKFCQEAGIKLSSAMTEIEECGTPFRQPESSSASQTQTQAQQQQQQQQQQLQQQLQQASLKAAAEAVSEGREAEFEEVKQDQLPERFRNQNELGSSSSSSSLTQPAPTFAAPANAPPASRPSAAVAQAGDPISGVSLDDVRSRIGKGKRNEAKLASSTFSEKYSMFESL